MTTAFAIHAYSQTLIYLGLSFGLGIPFFLILAIFFFGTEIKLVFKQAPTLFYFLAALSLTGLIIGGVNQTVKNRNRIYEHKYYYHIITIQKKAEANAATPLEINNCNELLNSLTIFQTEHPECLTGLYDWKNQPHIPED